MPTKNVNTAEVTQLRRRVSDLTDRIVTLENNLKKTQEMIQKDMNRLVEAVQQTR